MILKGPEKRVQKVKLSNTGSTLGTSFRDTFADIFGLVFKKVDLQILLRFRPLRALLQDSSESDVLWRRSLVGSSGRSGHGQHNLAVPLRAPCPAGIV